MPDVGPPPPPPKVELAEPQGPKIVVTAFRFTGNTLVSSDELAAALAGYVGKPLGLEDLRNAAAEISLHYRRQGYVATVAVPKQEVKAGEVTLRVLESRFGEVVFDPASDGRIFQDLMRRIILRAMPSGEPTDMRALDRGLLLVGDLPGASVTGGLAVGSEEGRSNLVLLSRRTPVWSGSVTADNAGARSTGEARGLASLAMASPRGWGEQFTADALKSEGALYGRLAAAFPVGDEGARVSFGFSRMDYELVAAEFAATRPEGQASTWSADYVQPLARSRVFNLNFSLGLEEKSFRNAAAGAMVSDYGIRVLSAGFNGNLYDGLLGGGVNSAQLTWSIGNLDLAGSPNQAAVAASTRAEGRFQKLRLALARTQNVAPDLVLAVSLNGQLASKNLDSAEKLFAGGVGAVRAYPINEGSGDAGYVAALEARWQCAPRWQAIAFVDHARMRVNADNAINGAAVDNSLTYEGAGLGLSWQGPADSVWRATWSRRLGDNPNPRVDGSDQDGSLRADRFWFSVALNF